MLACACVQVSTDLSPTNPYTTLIPLCVVFFITIIKQGIEDFKRHQADTAMNNRTASVIRNGVVVHMPWRAVCTGDMIVVFDKEEFPADVILLATSEEMGKCFTEVRGWGVCVVYCVVCGCMYACAFVDGCVCVGVCMSMWVMRESQKVANVVSRLPMVATSGLWASRVATF